jgi:hypothetical protein
MNLDLIDTTHSETVELPMRLQAREHPLYAGASVIDSLPLGVLWILLDSPLVRWMRLDDRLGIVLPPYQVPNALATVGSISNHIPRMKTMVDPTRLVQERRRNLDVMDTTTHNLHRHGMD